MTEVGSGVWHKAEVLLWSDGVEFDVDDVELGKADEMSFIPEEGYIGFIAYGQDV